MKSMTTNKRVRGEEGIAAILIAMFIMIILTLITLGFARIMRREQRQALDSSLTTQAFYAAESGINDAISAINSGALTTDINTCVSASFPNRTVSATQNASYSCLLVDQTPSNLEYNQGSITANRSTVIPIEASVPGQYFKTLTISWSSDDTAPHSFRRCTDTLLDTVSNWTGDTGLLRFDLVPIVTSSGNTVTRDSPGGLIDSTMSAYLNPAKSSCAGNSPINFASGTSNQGRIYTEHCNVGNTPRDCNMTINLPSTVHKYMLRVKSMYHNSNMTITGTDTSDANVSFFGAQKQIDSTGKVSDVVRRLQVRVPSKQVPVPEYVVQSMDGICKQLDVAPAPSPTADNNCP